MEDLVKSRRRFGLITVALTLSLALVLAACGGDDDDSSNASNTTAGGNSSTTTSSEPVTLRLGYFANTTHAPAIVGIEHGEFAKALGDNVTLEPSIFNAGPAAVEAIFGGALDASFIGPNPSINAYAQSNGSAVRVVSGTASGGAYLVVKPDVTAANLKGKTLATPQLGNTQDVALRTWLKSKGYETDTAGGGDVKILPQENSQTIDTFKAGQIDGAWVPEPYATRLVTEGGGKILVDEKDLWPNGKYVTTNLLVTTKFLDAHPDVVKNLIAGIGDSIDFIKASPADAEKVVADGIQKASGKPIAANLVTASFKNIDFTLDPVPSSLIKGAANAQAVGLLQPVSNLKGIYDLKLLNAVLKDRGETAVAVK
jgi:NitT/TauT family transport system substrate-binding protein